MTYATRGERKSYGRIYPEAMKWPRDLKAEIASSRPSVGTRNDGRTVELMLTGTEADIINCVARLRLAKKDQIRRQVGFSLEYIGFLCRDLIRRCYLGFSEGRYFLLKDGIDTLLAEDTPKIDRKLLKEIAEEVAREISGELKKTVKGIKIPVSVREMRKEAGEGLGEQIKIKTDFDLPVEDESLALESNIDRIGTRVERERSDDMDKTVRLFKEIHKKGRKR